MRFPLINLSDSEFSNLKMFSVYVTSELLIDKKRIVNHLNKKVIDCKGNEYLVTQYDVVKKEYNILFLLNNWLRPLYRIQLIYERTGVEMSLEDVRLSTLPKISQLWFLTSDEKIKLEKEINSSSTVEEIVKIISYYSEGW